MLKAIGRRLLLVIPVLLLVSLGTMLLLELIPGDPGYTVLGENATPEAVAEVNKSLGLDRPILERYVDFVGDAVQGDLGTSLPPSNRPVTDQVWERLPVTIELAVLGLLIAMLVAIPAAMYSAYRQDRFFDRAASATTSALISSPSFLTGLLLVYFVGLQWDLLPVTGWARLGDGLGENLKYALTPALTLALVEIPVYFRLLRSDLIATLQEDYVLSARAKGMPTRYILLRHALRPSSFSLLTVAGLSTGRLLGGSVIVEKLFALPGLGSLIVDSIFSKDYAIIQGTVLLVAVIYVGVNLAVDLLYATLDPRIRVAKR